MLETESVSDGAPCVAGAGGRRRTGCPGLVELAVVLEELGRAAAPGPWASTALAASVIAAVGDGGQAKSWLPRLADGSLPAAVVLPVAGADGAAMALPGLTATGGTD